MGDPSKLTAWERWELASLHGEASVPTAGQATAMPAHDDPERLRRAAHDEGFREGTAAGHAAGYAAGEAAVQAEARRLAAAAARLDTALDTLEAQIAEDVLALTVELARGVIRQEIAARPEILLAVVRQALAQLPHQHAAIYLHPDDASLLRSFQGDQLAHAGHRIHEDARLQRGDCVLEAGGSQVDGSLATRWRRVLENLGIEAAWQAGAVPPAPTSGDGGKNAA